MHVRYTVYGIRTCIATDQPLAVLSFFPPRTDWSMAANVIVVLLVLYSFSGSRARPTDWLVDTVTTPVSVQKEGNYLTISNGLISRQFTLSPALGTINFSSLMSQRTILRAINPEATVTLDGLTYDIGALTDAGTTAAYLNRTALELKNNPSAFQFVDYSTSKPVAPFHWEPGLRHSPADSKWPPEGLTLTLQFKAPDSVHLSKHANVLVNVSYEMYVGIPLLAKWVSVAYTGEYFIKIDGIRVEYLSTQKPYAPFDFGYFPNPWEHDTAAYSSSWLFVSTSLAHGTNVNWGVDPQVIPGADQPLLTAQYQMGPGVILISGSSDQKYSYPKDGSKMDFIPRITGPNPFESFRVFELVTDSDDRERMGLSRHRMTRTLMPQTQENPIFFHCTDASPINVRHAMDQMIDVGFELFIYSFGSGFAFESVNETYLEVIAAEILYAHMNGLEVGGYDLICLDRGDGGYGGNVGFQWDTVEENTYALYQDACFASGWYDVIHQKVFNFIVKTALDSIETDGPYGGGPCASTNHDYHLGLEDSIYWQNYYQGKLYSELKELNIFINQPDRYFYQGGNKIGMGYDETQYNLPRWQDLTVSRATMFDDTYNNIPTQGWMFLPLTQYHGGGAAAEFLGHPLEYEWGLAQYLGYGVAAAYRGPLLYLTDATRSVLIKWVSFYKEHRDILISDIVHVRRPDGQDIDCIMHVNPKLEKRGLAMVFNPTSTTLSRKLILPLYYTGISTEAMILHEGVMPGSNYTLERDYSVTVPINMPAKTVTWFLVYSVD